MRSYLQSRGIRYPKTKVKYEMGFKLRRGKYYVKQVL